MEDSGAERLWKRSGFSTITVKPHEDVLQKLIGKAAKDLQKVGGGMFGTVYKWKKGKKGKFIAVKVEELDGWRQERPHEVLPGLKAAVLAGDSGLAPKIHATILFRARSHIPTHIVQIMDFIAGPTLEEFAKTARPAEVEQVLTMLQRKVRCLNEQWIEHNDLTNPANLIVKLGRDCRVRDVTIVDFGISQSGKPKEEDKLQFLREKLRGSWAWALAGHFLRLGVV